MKTDSFYIYRKPRESLTVSRKGVCSHGLRDDSFIIAPFCNPSAGILSISDYGMISPEEIEALTVAHDSAAQLYELPAKSTTREEHRAEVLAIIESIGGNPLKKTIAARAICGEGRFDLLRSFDALAAAFPDALIFLFHTPLSGTWIGASPELLLMADSEGVRSCALAGTRPVGEKGLWDDKNLEEHIIVRNFLTSLFVKYGMTPLCEGPMTRKAGNVEHLFSSVFSPEKSQRFLSDTASFLAALSPTPALCGMPREESLALIRENERFERGWYGGFCGPFHDAGNFSLYVNLRSVWLAPSGWCNFAGGGITRFSDPDAEWEETERKSSGIISKLIPT